MIFETASESLSTTNDDIKASVALDVLKDCDLTSRMPLNTQYLWDILSRNTDQYFGFQNIEITRHLGDVRVIYLSSNRQADSYGHHSGYETETA